MLFAKNFRLAWALVRALSSTEQQHGTTLLQSIAQAAAPPMTYTNPYTNQRRCFAHPARPEWAQELINFGKRPRSSLASVDREQIVSLLQKHVMQEDGLSGSRIADVLWSTCRLHSDPITKQCRAAQEHVFALWMRLLQQNDYSVRGIMGHIDCIRACVACAYIGQDLITDQAMLTLIRSLYSITTFLNHVGYSSLYFVIGSLSRPGPVQEAFQQLLTALGPSTQQQLAVLDFKGLCHILTAYASTEHVPKSIHLERLLAEALDRCNHATVDKACYFLRIMANVQRKTGYQMPQEVTDAVLTLIMSKADQLGLWDVRYIMYGSKHMKHNPDFIDWEVLGVVINRDMQNASNQWFSDIVYGLGMVGHIPSTMSYSRVMEELLLRSRKMQPTQIARVLEGMRKLPYQPPPNYRPTPNLVSLVDHAFDGKAMGISLASIADLCSKSDDELGGPNTTTSAVHTDVLISVAKYVLANLKKVSFHFLARIYYSLARLSVSLPVEDTERILQHMGEEMQARLDGGALTPASQLLFVKEVVAGTVLYYGRKPELLVRLLPLVQPIVALLRDPDVLQSETLPVQGLADVLSACTTYDGLIAEAHEGADGAAPRLLSPMVTDRLQVILHNSRIVEGFMDELSSEGEEEGSSSSQEDEDGEEKEGGGKKVTDGA